MGKEVISSWSLNNKKVNAPVEWSDAEVLATFDNDATQANITIDKFTFVNQEATDIITHINTGLSGGVGITEGIPMRIDLTNKSNFKNIFDGYIDLSNVQINEFNNKVICDLKLKDEVLKLEERLQALSFGYLESLGVIHKTNYTDIQYVVQKKNNIIESIILSITIYLMTKEIIDTIVRLTKDKGNTAAHTAGGTTGALAAVIYETVLLILDVVYAALLLVAIVKMASSLLSQIIPIKRKAKGITYRTALEIVSSYLGYSFKSNISDLDVCYYIPSNLDFDKTDASGIVNEWVGNSKGIPSSSDYGYNCADFFSIVKTLFNGKFAIIDNTICFYNVDDIFWVKTSSYKMPLVRDKIKTYNTDELKANRYLTFETDITDEWTIDEYKGTSYEVITTPVIVTNSKLNSVKGLEEIRFNICLGTRKDTPLAIESLMIQFASLIDGIIDTLGGRGTFVAQIKTSIGLMKVSTNNWAMPKTVKLNNNRLVKRDSWSAKYIYDTYYRGSSFISTVNSIPYYGQKEVYRSVKIPFGLNDLVLLINNSYFTLSDGRVGKVISCKYRFSSDYATVDYYVRTPYTYNLKETYIEP